VTDNTVILGGRRLSTLVDRDPRGVRLNNPTNIRHGRSAWRGMAREQPDPDFVAYEEPLYGLRAAAVLLANYRRRYGIGTLGAVAARWAPADDHNDVLAYTATLARVSRYDADREIDLSNPSVLARVIPAIVVAENSVNPYTPEQIVDAIILAGVTQPEELVS
jgi:hypothetical protein